MIKVTKRDGSSENFSVQTLKNAIKEAFKSAKVKQSREIINAVANAVQPYDGIPVEEIQDQIENSLMLHNYAAVAKEFILYRNRKKEIREFTNRKLAYIERYKQSANTANATVDDNSNVACKNIGVLNAEIHKEDNILVNRRMIRSKIKQLYPDFKVKQYEKDLKSHVIYKNDESSFAGALAPYCVALTMYPFLNHGIEKIGGLSAHPQNLDSFCGMYSNLIFAVSAQFAGAVATPEFLLCFDYFCRKEWGDDYWKEYDRIIEPHKEIMAFIASNEYDASYFGGCKLFSGEWTSRLLKKYGKFADSFGKNGKFADGTKTIRYKIHQCFQQVIYSINQPAAARGLQSAFVNFAYFDKPFFDGMFDKFVFPDEKGTKPCWDSLNHLQKDFMMWFNEERLRNIITFPVESYALVYQDGHFLDQESADFVAAEYARGHSFFTYISDTVDSLSSCCRLKNKIQTKEFNYTNGNLGVQTGSKSVITLNLSRICQDWWAQMKKQYPEIEKSNVSLYYGELKEYIKPILERVYIYHTAYNEILWDMYDAGLLPVYKAGFIHLDKQYLTIGINGLNQAAEFFELDCNDNEYYAEFCQTIFSFIKEMNTSHKCKFNGHQLTFNTECIPAESLAIKNYNWDKEDGYWVPKDTNLYASYIYKPNDPKLDLYDKIRMHGANYIGDYLDGGSAAHINLSEHLSEKQYKKILEYAAKNGCQYFTFNIPNAECADCGYISKVPFAKCPKCGSTHVNLYDRIIGYLTKIANWSEGRQIEQKTRIYLAKDEIKK